MSDKLDKLARPALYRFADKCYLLDKATNILLQVPHGDEFAVLELFKKSSNTLDFESWIKDSLVKHETNNPGFFETLLGLKAFVGAFSQRTTEEPKLPTEEDIYDRILRDGLFELILETTRACNLRCKYCIFSGIYDGFRSHSNENMTHEVAVQAVDMYFKYLSEGSFYNPDREPTIAFYGGEPLLNFALIRSVVDYVKDKYSTEFAPRFTITTNGTLLTDQIADFLISNGFSIFISLDGPEDEHDRNRVFPNGSGTFSTVIRNIQKTVDRARKFDAEQENTEVYALVTYDIKTDMRKVRKFFDEESPIRPILFSPVRPSGTNYYAKFSVDDKENFWKTKRELKEEFLEYVTSHRSDEKISIFLENFFGFPVIMSYYRSLLSTPVGVPFTQTCIPGFKIHVDTGGMLHPCEKTPTEIVVGSVSSGLDVRLIRDILRAYREHALHGCTECSMGQSCANCIATLGLRGDTNVCRNTIDNRRDSLELMTQVQATNPEYFEQRLGRFLEMVNKIDLR
jgi:uncharacterized protein